MVGSTTHFGGCVCVCDLNVGHELRIYRNIMNNVKHRAKNLPSKIIQELEFFIYAFHLQWNNTINTNVQCMYMLVYGVLIYLNHTYHFIEVCKRYENGIRSYDSG